MKNNIIGIDFSLNSAAFCALRENDSKLGSLYRSNESPDKLLKKKDGSILYLSEFEHLRLDIIEKEQFTGEYHEVERKKIDSFIVRVDHFFSMMRPYVNKETRIFMEGISFGSSGNSLIDISMATALLRERILGLIPKEQFYVFSPSSIKKFALKGNAKKNELYETLLTRDDKRIKDFQKILEDNKSSWIKGSKEVVAPCNDLVDAVWISLFGENFLQNPQGNLKK